MWNQFVSAAIAQTPGFALKSAHLIRETQDLLMSRKHLFVFEFALLAGLLSPQGALAQTNDLSGRTADSIRKILTLVANHQLRSLADGAYPTCYSLNAAGKAAKPIGLEWDYAWGLNLYGLLRVSEVTGDANIENFALNHNLVAARYYSWLLGLTSTCTNAAGAPQNTAGFYAGTVLADFFAFDVPLAGQYDPGGSMATAVLEGALRHATGPTPEQIQVAHRMSNYLSNVQSRLPDGTLYRPDLANAIWADDLYMNCPFLIRWYEFTGDTNLLNDAARQIINVAGYLEDTNGLWFHGYYVASQRVNGIKWGRANGWAMLATTEVLSLMPTNHPAFPNLLGILRRHIEAVKSVQQSSGMWRQILDYNNAANWDETSATAMFACCIARAVNRGWIDPTNMLVAHQAFVGLCKNITPGGNINETCQLTLLGTTASYYLGRHRPANDMHGRGPVMLAGAEILSGQIAPPAGALTVSKSGSVTSVSWPVALTNYVLETTTNLITWTQFTGDIAVANSRSLVTDPTSSQRFFHLRPPWSPDYEAELLSYPAYITNGATNVLSSDLKAGGGVWLAFNAQAVGQSIEFVLPDVPAGAYRVSLTYRADKARGQHSLQVDGVTLGSVIDQYRLSSAFLTTNFGTINFSSAGNHPVRLTVTGKNAASSAYTLSADKFTLTPQ